MHVDDFRNVIKQSGYISQHRLLKTAISAGHTNSDEIYIHCEAPNCNESFLLADAYSMAAVFRMPGRNISAFQCPDEQHFGCCVEHAIAAMNDCLENHIKPLHNELRKTNELNVVKITEISRVEPPTTTEE